MESLLLSISIVAILISFFVKLRAINNRNKRKQNNSIEGNQKDANPNEYTYYCSAETKYPNSNHQYKFNIKKQANGEYFCYIESQPSYLHHDLSHFTPHYWIEDGMEKIYICWTTPIMTLDEAKTLCKMWSNATQIFVDTGIPAEGFTK